MDPARQRASRIDMAILPDPQLPGGRLLQQQKAKEMTVATEDRARRYGIPVPDYEFLELIGKGSFGRVYKCRSKKTASLVAVKVMEVDKEDFKLDFNSRDAQLTDITNEISILQTLKDSKAKNVNILHEAFAFHSQLWVVNEYCPGGSLQTLMRVRNNLGFEEKYIIAICRELIVALKHVHSMGIIHRDVKAANVLITQDGGLQLCDFGVSGILDSGSAKRSTIIGTPFWMPPEMHTAPGFSQGYGTEIDCWAFGCTAYELATGQPPNARIDPSKLHLFLRAAPRLEGEKHSDVLKEFVSFCLVGDPKLRPTAAEISKHSYIDGTERLYPTTILRELIENFAHWERQGGQRASLFNAHGAGGPGTVASFIGGDDEWNFSTTDDFDLGDGTSFLNPSTPLTAKHLEDDESTPQQTTHPAERIMSPLEKAKEEMRIARGGQMMGRIFNDNPSAAEYSFGQQEHQHHEDSDLPFRRDYHGSEEERKSIIDLDAMTAVNIEPGVDLGDVPTIRPSKVNQFYNDDDDDEGDDEGEEDDDTRYPYYNADDRYKRQTKDWKFPTATMPAAEPSRPRTIDWSMEAAAAEARSRNRSVDVADDLGSYEMPHVGALGPPFRPKLIHTATEPIGQFGDHLHPASASYANGMDRTSLIDLDEGSVLSRPSTASSSAGHFESFTTDPFDFTDRGSVVVVEEEDGLQTIKRRPDRTSVHGHSQSEPTADRTSQLEPFVAKHSREISNVTDSSFERNFNYSVGASVGASAESLRRNSEADDADEEWESANERAVAPMLTDPSHEWPSMWSRQSNSFDARTDEWSDTASRDEGLTLSARHVLPGNDTSFTSSDRSGPISNGIVTRADVEHERYERARALYSKFPPIAGPNAASLEEGAEPSVLAAELDRLLADFMAGLEVAGSLMGFEVRGFAADEPSETASSTVES